MRNFTTIKHLHTPHGCVRIINIKNKIFLKLQITALFKDFICALNIGQASIPQNKMSKHFFIKRSAYFPEYTTKQ